MSLNTLAQDLSDHQWKNRLVLILTESKSLGVYKDQINELLTDRPDLEERKLVIYSVMPDQYKKGITSQEWVNSKDLYDEYKKAEDEFEVILIGLDGGVKLRQTKLLTNDKLFAIIDGMPMRRAEIRREKK